MYPLINSKKNLFVFVFRFSKMTEQLDDDDINAVFGQIAKENEEIDMEKEEEKEEEEEEEDKLLQKDLQKIDAELALALRARTKYDQSVFRLKKKKERRERAESKKKKNKNGGDYLVGFYKDQETRRAVFNLLVEREHEIESRGGSNAKALTLKRIAARCAVSEGYVSKLKIKYFNGAATGDARQAFIEAAVTAPDTRGGMRSGRLKMTDEIRQFASAWIDQHQYAPLADMSQAIKQQFGIEFSTGTLARVAAKHGSERHSCRVLGGDRVDDDESKERETATKPLSRKRQRAVENDVVDDNDDDDNSDDTTAMATETRKRAARPDAEPARPLAPLSPLPTVAPLSLSAKKQRTATSNVCMDELVEQICNGESLLSNNDDSEQNPSATARAAPPPPSTASLRAAPPPPPQPTTATTLTTNNDDDDDDVQPPPPAKKQRRSSGLKMNEERKQWLKDIYLANPRLTLKKAQAQLLERHGVDVCLSTVSKTLIKLGFKRRFRHVASSSTSPAPSSSGQEQEQQEQQEHVDKGKELVGCDEEDILFQ
jgi:hypothetical protein